LTGKHFDIVADYMFEPGDDVRTTLTQRSQVTGKRFFKIMPFVIGLIPLGKTSKATKHQLEELRSLCETGGAGSSTRLEGGLG